MRTIFLLILYLSVFINTTFADVKGRQETDYYGQIELPYGWETKRIFKPLIISPFDVVISPKGEVLITGLENDQIYKVSSDGKVTSLVNAGRTTLAVNSRGELFCDSFDRILKISPPSKIETFVSGMGAYQMAVGPSGDLFIIESRSDVITKVNQKGERAVFVKGLSNPCDLEFSPSGELYVTQAGIGEISKINVDGSVTTVAKGLGRNDPVFIAFDPSGHLFALDTMMFGLARVSIENGTLSPLPLFSSLMSSGAFGDFIFDKNGDVILLGTTKNFVFRICFGKEKIRVLVPGCGNSYALAIGKSGEVFMGDDNSFPFLPGRVVKIGMDGTVRTFTEGFGFIRDMVFDSDGNLYIFSFVPGKEQISEGTIFKISTNGSSSKIFTTPHPFSSIAINPATGDLVGFDTVEDRFITITPELKVSTLSIDFGEDVFRTKIAFDKKGNLFVLALFSENFGIGPLKRRLFKITPHNEVTLFANLDTPSSSSTDDICIAPSGDIFVIASEPPVFKMLKMTPAGKITVFAKNLPCDPLSLATDLQGNIFFASSAGVFKIFKSK